MVLLASRSIGEAGWMEIHDDGSTVVMRIKSDYSATNGNIPISVYVGGGWSNWFNVYYPTGANWLNVWAGTVNPSQSVAFRVGETGTSGMGSGGELWASVSRATKPGVPGTPTSSATGTTQMTLSWTIPSNGGAAIDQMLLRRSDSPSFPAGYVDYPNAGNATSRVVTGLAPNSRYYWRVYAHNPIGYSDPSGTLNTVTLPAVVPPQPPAPTVSATTQDTITVNVTDPAGLGPAPVTRTVHVSAQTSFGVITQSFTNPAATFTVSSLTRATMYYVRQKLTNIVGDSPWSATGQGSTVGTPPSAPTGYSVYDIASTSATVSTGSLADNGGQAPSQIRVKVSTTASDVGLVQTITRDRWAPVLLSSLTKGQSYYVAEAAFNAAPGGGWGPYGAWVPFTTRTDVPNAPVLSLDSVSGTTAVLEWTAPTQLNGALIGSYKLLVSTDASLAIGALPFSAPDGTLSVVVDPLSAATVYYAIIWTETDKGRGSSSDIFTFTTTGGGGSAMPFWLNVAGVQKQITEVWQNIDGTWKLMEPWFNVAGTWKKE